MSVFVTSAAEAGELERGTMRAGVSASDLMRHAGEAAAAEILRLHGDRVRNGVTVFAGSGNNGGDGWVVAGRLAPSCKVTVVEVGSSKTPEAKAARDAAIGVVTPSERAGAAGVVVDALLGTGGSGPPRGSCAEAVRAMAGAREAGAIVLALDIPSGLDATTGEREGSVVADTTLTFGSVKRGTLLARDVCGRLLVLDIGLRSDGLPAPLPTLVLPADVFGFVPRIPADAHKGTRRKLAVVGGGEGMAGAALLAAGAALRSGIGLLRLCVSPPNVAAAHAGAPAALVSHWPVSDADLAELVSWADAIVIGPGLGNSAETRALVERIIAAAGDTPLVLDADALNVFSGDMGALSGCISGRSAVITPHPAELGRLMGVSAADVSARRFDIAAEAARSLGVAVLLKGAPTVIASARGDRRVSATGTAALATGGSGDVLSGMIGTLLAQTRDPFGSAGAAAWVHGRAAELATGGRSARGTTLDDVIAKLPDAWQPIEDLAPPVLAELPAVN